MRRALMTVVLSGIAVALSSGAALGQPKTDLGESEYDAKCASCHGLSGKGEGSFGEIRRSRRPT